MMTKTPLNRLYALSAAIERNLRAFRAELATLAELAPEDDAGRQPIGTGLAALLHAGDAIEPTTTAPYEPFAPGVWTSSPPGGDTAVVVQHAVLRTRGAQADAVVGRRLIVAPTVTTDTMPGWVTLETEVDFAALKAAETLRFDLTAHFRIPAGNRVPLPPTYKVILRLRDAAGTVKDVYENHLPVSTIPMSHAFAVGKTRKEAFKTADYVGGVVIFFLPQVGDYGFCLDEFELSALKA